MIIKRMLPNVGDMITFGDETEKDGNGSVYVSMTRDEWIRQGEPAFLSINTSDGSEEPEPVPTVKYEMSDSGLFELLSLSDVQLVHAKSPIGVHAYVLFRDEVEVWHGGTGFAPLSIDVVEILKALAPELNIQQFTDGMEDGVVQPEDLKAIANHLGISIVEAEAE